MSTTTSTKTTILRPGDAAYALGCGVFNAALELCPAAIALPGNAKQAGDAVRQAADEGLNVAIVSGAHNAGPLGALDQTMLLRTERLADGAIDPVGRRARAGAGVRWGAVVEAAAPHGLAALHASSPTVGVAGYPLGGGVGWLARRHGLQTNRVTAVDLVTADGALRRIDDDSAPELMWALRGGGGNFGVVTALEFELLDVRDAYAGWLAWDWTASEAVLHRWREWTSGLDDAVTTSARILQPPPDPALPEPIRGRNLVVIDGAILADDERARELLAPLRELRPELDTFGRVPAPALSRLHGDPEEPMPSVGATRMLRHLPSGAVDGMIAAAGPDAGAMLVIAELRHLGAAAARVNPRAAGGHLDGEFLAFALAPVFSPEQAAIGHEHCERAMSALVGGDFGFPYLNFAEHSVDPAAGWPEHVLARMRQVKRVMDPGALFTANHGL